MTTAFEENEISIKANGGTELMKRRLAERIPLDLQADFQVICSRVRKLHENKIRIYWVHDLPWDPEVAPHLKSEEAFAKFHAIVFCGTWLYQAAQAQHNLPFTNRFHVIDNAIEPFPDTVLQKPRDIIRIVYTSSPQRGLELLVPIFVELAKHHDNIELDVFSSFKIYGWDEADKRYEQLFRVCQEHPKIRYHGVQPNSVVREVLAKAHIFAYPSIWPECNSLALIEAMSAGLLCLHPKFAGLVDTSGGITTSYMPLADHQAHAALHYHLLNDMITRLSDPLNFDNMMNYAAFVKAYADTRFNIRTITDTWLWLMKQLLLQYPTPESRAIPKPKPSGTFTYRTS